MFAITPVSAASAIVIDRARIIFRLCLSKFVAARHFVMQFRYYAINTLMQDESRCNRSRKVSLNTAFFARRSLT